MASGQQVVILRQVQRLFGRGTIAGMAEGKMLERFVASRDEEAFEALIALHGPMVLGVCRRLLSDPHDIEDAFQATFVVLVRRAASLRDRELLGAWLYGVARRVAARARADAARRRNREWHVEGDQAVAPSHDADGLELREVIDEEVGRLPEKLRWPVILCHLEGRTYEEAAQQLRWTAATVRGRLVQARERLRNRLIRRGVAPSVVLPLIQNGLPFGPPAVSADLVATTLNTATRAAFGKAAAAGVTSATVPVLVESVVRSLFMIRVLKIGLAATSLLAIGLGAAAGMSWLSAPVELALASAPEARKDNAAAQAVAKEKSTPAKAARARIDLDEEWEIHKITITGQARDTSGQAMAGATVQVTDANQTAPSDAENVYGRTATGADGRFILRDVSIRVLTEQPGAVPKPREGAFEVAAWAPGQSFTWHVRQGYRPEKRPALAKPEDAGRIFYEGETIESNLVFGPPTRLHGKLTDDRGRPIEGAKIQVGYIDSLRSPDSFGMWNCVTINPNGGDEVSFNGMRFLPESRRSTRSDANGNYAIEGLPRETKLLALIQFEPSYEAVETMIATSSKSFQGVRSLGYDGTFNHRFVSPRSIRVRVTQGDTGKPAPGATVIAEGPRMQRDGASGKTDSDGYATLRLLPNAYTLRAEPPREAPYIVTERPLKVTNDPPEQAVSLALDPGAVVVFEAVDAETGLGSAGVGALYDTDTNRQRKEVRSQTVYVDHPVTGADGKFRAVLAPGAYRFYSVIRSASLEPVMNQSSLLTLKAGGTTTVRFHPRKKPMAKPEEPKAAAGDLAGQLEMRWNIQRMRTEKMRIKAKRYYLGGESISPESMRQFLDSLDPNQYLPLLDLIEKRFPDAKVPNEAVLEFVVDGRQRQQRLYALGEDKKPYLDHVTVSNGSESVMFSPRNAQVDLSGGTGKGQVQFGTYNVSEFCLLPLSAGKVVGREKARVTFENSRAGQTVRMTVDEITGFVYRASSGSSGGKTGTDHWQFAPKTNSEGLTTPGMGVEMVYEDDKADHVWINVIESMDSPASIPPESFVLPVPPGTLILDYRQGNEDNYRGVTRSPVSDVIAYTDRINETRKPIVSPITPGQTAPPIKPLVWLDRAGKIEAPVLAGKVVLVDFWGITCGPCVAELPAVREAVEHFAGTDLLVVGLHDSGGTLKEVAEFAAKREMKYPLAIDHPAKEEGWFGATFAAYGVRGIPAAAVIDRAGKVVFVGRFPEALERAAALLKDGQGARKGR